MKKLLLTSCLALGIASGLFADSINPVAAVGGAATGVTKLNLNGAPGAVATASGSGLTISGTGGAQAVVGSLDNIYAAPFFSGLNGAGFGDAPGAYQDNTRYLSTGIGSITFDFGAANKQNYFGLLWGSVDKYNSLAFYDGMTLLGTVWGSNPFFTSQDGDQGVNGTFYVNIFAGPGVMFDKVVATSTEYAFEIDNVAFGVVSVPDSGATVALLGLSFACLFFFRRKAA